MEQRSASAPPPDSSSLALPRGRRLQLTTAPLVMGIVNVTPDSFSDGGRFLAPDHAVEHALRLLDEGADLVDVGAESTRPGGGVYGAGARTLTPAEELERLAPVVARLRAATAAPISVDTRKGEVARRALELGADLVNDVGGLGDPELVRACVDHGCPVIVMHSRGSLETMQRDIRFHDVVGEVASELRARCALALAAGVPREQILVDPGLGFGKSGTQNFELIAGSARLARETGFPVVMGASRKSFLSDREGPEERLGGSLATIARAVIDGVAMVRVHDVAETVQFLEVWRGLDAIDSTRRAFRPIDPPALP